MFAFVYAPMTPLGSTLSSRFPRFATHLTLIGVFLAGNILCALAPNYAVLVVARIMIAAVSGTWVANMFGWRWAFHPVIAMTVVVIAMTVVVIVLIIACCRITATWRRSVFCHSRRKD